jgi:hypothetical protein
MPLDFDPTPRALVEDGRFQFGTFRSGPPRVNLLESRPPLLRALAWLGLKEWQAFQAGDAEHFLLGAVYSSKRIDLLQLIIVHKASGRMHKWEEKVPPWRLRVAQGLAGTTSFGEARGLAVRFENDLPAGSLRVVASATPRARSATPAASLNVTGHPAADRSGHLVICHPFSDDRALYSHKCMMPAEGGFVVGGTACSLSTATSFMILDDHKGFYPSPMVYDWVTGASRADGGDVVGINLTANQVRDPGRYNENALFRGNRVDRLPEVRFERPGGVHATWHVTDPQGRVNVRFRPVVRNEVSVGPRKLLADYHGPFGWLEGYVIDDAGERVHLDGMFGMGEKKWIRL